MKRAKLFQASQKSEKRNSKLWIQSLASDYIKIEPTPQQTSFSWDSKPILISDTRRHSIVNRNTDDNLRKSIPRQSNAAFISQIPRNSISYQTTQYYISSEPFQKIFENFQTFFNGKSTIFKYSPRNERFTPEIFMLATDNRQ